MTNYYETKSQPITRIMVWQSYWKVRSNRGCSGIDEMDWEEMDKNRNSLLYKLWNRMSSGSYYPPPVKEVGIKKKDGGTRYLGIPTILDRIAQDVVRSYLEPILEPHFHSSSFGYRKGLNCHMAVKQATENAFRYGWAIDLDIKGFFDNIDHEMLLKALLQGQVGIYVCSAMVECRRNSIRWEQKEQTKWDTTGRSNQSFVGKPISPCFF